MRKTLLVLAAPLAALFGVLAFAGSADAHTNALSGQAACNSTTVTWTLTNQYTLDEVATPPGQTVTAGSTVTFTDTSTSLTVHGVWSDGFTADVTATATAASGCTTTTTTTPATTTTTTPATTTTTAPATTTTTAPVTTTTTAPPASTTTTTSPVIVVTPPTTPPAPPNAPVHLPPAGTVAGLTPGIVPMPAPQPLAFTGAPVWPEVFIALGLLGSGSAVLLYRRKRLA